MGRLVIVLAILGVASAKSLLGSGLRVTFNIGLRPGKDFFFDIPRNVDDALANDWTLVDRPTSPLPTLTMYCRELVLCTLYDPDTNFIAGVQIALPLNDSTDTPLDWTAQGFTSWTPPVASGAESVTYMTKQLYFVSEETLTKSKEVRMQAALANDVLQENSVWPIGFNQQLIEVPTNVDGILKMGFTKQACIPWMGQHYYYNMSTETTCTSESLLNWFPLTNSNQLIGMGFVFYGAVKEEKGQRSFFETPTKSAVQTIVPNGPQCLYEMAEDPALTTLHIYFVNRPWLIFCSLMS